MVKIAPPSADMLIKLAVLGVGVGVAVYAVRRVTGAVSDAAGQAWGALERGAQWVMDGTRYINPASPDNRGTQDSPVRRLANSRGPVPASTRARGPGDARPFNRNRG